MDWFKDSIEMVKDYLSDLGDFKELYKIIYIRSNNNRSNSQLSSLEDFLLFKENAQVYEVDVIKLMFIEK